MKIRIILFLTLLFSFISSPNFSSTACADCRGCCSDHGGVICRDGVTLCADGTLLSDTCEDKSCDKCESERPPATSPAPATPGEPGGSSYDRDDWMPWEDTDGDCLDTRAEILIRDSKIPVQFSKNSSCGVFGAVWVCPYSHKTRVYASDMDIDHIVPLAHANSTGGASWSEETKRRFANDFMNLLAVDDSTNRSKGARGPEEWKPPIQDYWREYALKWRAVKEKYGLTISDSEEQALREMEENVPDCITLNSTPTRIKPATFAQMEESPVKIASCHIPFGDFHIVTSDLNFPCYTAPVDIYVAYISEDGIPKFLDSTGSWTTAFVPHAEEPGDTVQSSFAHIEFDNPPKTVYWAVVPANGGDFSSIAWESKGNELGWYDLDRELFPLERIDHTTTELSGMTYTMGGRTEEDGELVPTFAVEIYDAATKKRRLGSPLPNTHFKHESFLFNDKIYVVGGAYDLFYSLNLPYDRYTDIIDIYDPSTDSWSTAATKPNLNHIQSAVFEDELYLFGEYHITPAATGPFPWITNEVFAYNPEQDRWRSLAALPSSIPPFEQYEARIIDDSLYIVTLRWHEGAYKEHSYYNYDTLRDSWIKTEKPE